MSTSLEGILAYGYVLGGPDHGWKVQEVGEYGTWTPVWSIDEGFCQGAATALLASVGFTDAYYPGSEREDYFHRLREANIRVGCELVRFCHIERPQYMLVAYNETASIGQPKTLDLSGLVKNEKIQVWNQKLAAALKALDVTPRQEAPDWILAADYS